MKPRWPALLTLSLAAVACGDPKGSGAGTSGDAQSAAAVSGQPRASSDVPGNPSGMVTAAPPSSAAALAPPEEVDATAVPAEPQRKTLRAVADDPALYANRDFVADRWGVVRLPLPLELQTVPLPHARRALLLTGQGPALEKPLILVVEQDSTLLWSKDRVLAGTRERARELTLTRGPHGEVLVVWYDEPTKILAAREWTHQGEIFADFNVLTSEGCDAMTVLHWPGRGWVAVLLDGLVLRAQLLGENGSRQWADNGVEVRIETGTLPGTRPVVRPKIAVVDGKIEVTVGARKVKLSADGSVVR